MNHFEGKKPYEHILQKRSEMAHEIHGDELPGHQGAFLDALRDTSMLFMIFWTLFVQMGFPKHQMFMAFILLGIGWFVWKISRSAWLAQVKLDRLHRVLKEERYEIENHRPQEREELEALYAAKGFKGPLLQEVLDVLMADDERLLKIMIEEEMGLNLENCEHPLKVGTGAGLGVLLSSIILLVGQWIASELGLITMAALLVGFSGLWIAKLQKNETMPAFVWNVGFTILTFGIVYFLTSWTLLLIS